MIAKDMRYPLCGTLIMSHYLFSVWLLRADRLKWKIFLLLANR